jgi:hypothetical protein
MENVEVAIRYLGTDQVGWKFQLSVRNKLTHSIFVMTQPSRSDRSSGPYVSLAADDTLEFSIQLFPRPPYCLYSNDARVKLEKLDPETEHIEVFSVKVPLLSTLPPYGNHPVRVSIEKTKIKFIKASVGLLPDEEGIIDILKRKSASTVNGLEKLFVGPSKGKQLIDLQTIVSSAPLPFRAPADL